MDVCNTMIANTIIGDVIELINVATSLFRNCETDRLQKVLHKAQDFVESMQARHLALTTKICHLVIAIIKLGYKFAVVKPPANEEERPPHHRHD